MAWPYEEYVTKRRRMLSKAGKEEEEEVVVVVVFARENRGGSAQHATRATPIREEEVFTRESMTQTCRRHAARATSARSCLLERRLHQRFETGTVARTAAATAAAATQGASASAWIRYEMRPMGEEDETAAG